MKSSPTAHLEIAHACIMYLYACLWTVYDLSRTCAPSPAGLEGKQDIHLVRQSQSFALPHEKAATQGAPSRMPTGGERLALAASRRAANARPHGSKVKGGTETRIHQASGPSQARHSKLEMRITQHQVKAES